MREKKEDDDGELGGWKAIFTVTLYFAIFGDFASLENFLNQQFVSDPQFDPLNNATNKHDF